VGPCGYERKERIVTIQCYYIVKRVFAETIFFPLLLWLEAGLGEHLRIGKGLA
jgi:hypothetical protein